MIRFYIPSRPLFAVCECVLVWITLSGKSFLQMLMPPMGVVNSVFGVISLNKKCILKRLRNHKWS